MDRRAWRATVYGVTKSQTRLSDQHFQVHMDRTLRDCFCLCVDTFPPNLFSLAAFHFKSAVTRMLSRFSHVHSLQSCGHSLPGSSVHGMLLNPGTELTSLMSSASVNGFFTASASWEALFIPGKRERRSFGGLGYLLAVLFSSCPWRCPMQGTGNSLAYW